MDNLTLARKLREFASRLEATGINLYRVKAYRRAAALIQMHPRELSELLAEGGREALAEIPGIGTHLAYTLEHALQTGEIRSLAGEEETLPDDRLTSLPGVGAVMARKIKDGLGTDNLDEVERAARDGRLENLGFGPKRLRGLLDALEARRNRLAPVTDEPSVADLLEVDGQYRALAGRSRSSEVPVLCLALNGWTYRALFDQSALAGRLNRLRDWVVIHFQDGLRQGSRLVVTQPFGPLLGRRVVRGREKECAALLQPEREMSA